MAEGGAVVGQRWMDAVDGQVTDAQGKRCGVGVGAAEAGTFYRSWSREKYHSEQGPRCSVYAGTAQGFPVGGSRSRSRSHRIPIIFPGAGARVGAAVTPYSGWESDPEPNYLPEPERSKVSRLRIPAHGPCQ